MAKMMKMPSVMRQGHSFAQVPGVSVRRSVFDRSHGHKLTFNAGYLVPILVDEILPGDTVACNMRGFARLTSQALQKPIMDNLYFETFFFFCPMRLVWANARKFWGEQDNPGDSISYVVPICGTPWTPGASSLFDYMGVMPNGIPGSVAIQTPNAINALPFRIANLIYNTYFRDQNLIASLAVSTGDGPDSNPGTTYVLQKRAKKHDYFTSSLPFLQKGTAVSLPLGVSAIVKPSATELISGIQNPYILRNIAGAFPTDGAMGVSGATGKMGSNASAFTEVNELYASNLYADLSTATSATINELRLAFQTQAFLERDARGGTRYIEFVKAHWGVTNPDFRLQRPEYLGGGSTPVIVNPVTQTGQTGLTGGTTALGSLAGIGSVMALGHGFHKAFTEHGYILGFCNVRADLTYQQGLERMWTRATRLDFAFPEFANIGEQAILNREIYWVGTTAASAQDLAAFGYIPRFDEYRYKPSRISGAFRSQLAAPLDQWHLAQEFGALPTLSQTFIEDDTTTILDRVVAVTSEPDFLADLWFNYRHARALPVFGVPGFGSRF